MREEAVEGQEGMLQTSLKPAGPWRIERKGCEMREMKWISLGRSRREDPSRMPHGPDPRIWCNKRLKRMQWSVRGLRRISKADSRLVLKAFLLISSISGSARMKSFVEFYRRLGNTKSRFDANISSIESCWWQPKPLLLLQIKNFYHRACNEQSVSRRSAMSFISMMWRAQAITNTKKSRHIVSQIFLHDACGFRGFVKRVSSGEFAWQAKL